MFNATFIEIAQFAMSVFAQRVLLLQGFSTRFVEEFTGSSQLDVPLVSAGAEPTDKGDKDFDDATIIDETNHGTVSVLIDQHKVNGIAFSMEDLRGVSKGYINEVLKAKIALKMNGMADTVLQYVFGKVVAASFPGEFIVDPAAYTQKTVAIHAAELRELNFPLPGTIGILGKEYYTALISDPTVSNGVQAGLISFTNNGATMTNKDALPLSQARLPAGISGFYAARDALAVGMQPQITLPDGMSLPPGVELETIVDPDSGVVMNAYKWFNPNSGKWIINFICNFGAKACNPAALQRLKIPA